ncbi:MAG: hypothetical protein GDA50_04965 [Alphaproteobacteria bacterium GM202ARS2]|nr:hypothetical protein [Alphaproteobacteria bacterium GM202ARS2]
MNAPSLITSETLMSLPDARVFEASWFMGDNRERSQGYEHYATSHIAGAVFFDIDKVAERTSTLPHMLPSVEDFRLWAVDVGIEQDDQIVVYDRHPSLMSAPRAWWVLRCFGYDKVAVLDGGFNAWLEKGGKVEKGEGNTTFASRKQGAFVASVSDQRARYCASLEDVRAASRAGAPQIIDARSEGRFDGREQEPRAGLASGHIPSSRNVPYASVCDDKGHLLTNESLRQLFASRGVDVDKPAVTSCGSGITACVLAFALHQLGNQQVRVYDGSWTEWGTEWGTERGTP